jgi:uncharacterized membrane protein
LDTRQRLKRLEKNLTLLQAQVANEPPSTARLPPFPGQPPAPSGVQARPPAVRKAPETDRSSRLEWLIRGVWGYLTAGNALVRAGVVVLFFGVAFLFGYAVENVYLAMEWRLLGVAMSGLIMLGLGWRLRTRRFGYGLTLQGGGIGIFYLTVFASFRLYGLLPPLWAFAILVVCALLSATIAVAQNARILALLGAVGGFLAPLLASPEHGGHVLLFSYYLVLNASILVIAWFKAWRPLNVVGFIFTFALASLWGYRYYQPAFFTTMEPFLVLFFLFYVAISVLFALRQPPRLKGYVDGTLVFGTPLLVFGLQAALVAEYPQGLNWSALVMGMFYLGLATALSRLAGTGMRLLAEAFLAIGVAFGSVAIFLWLDARWTGTAWALEGAALIWIGARQGRLPTRLFGMLLQLGAGAMLALEVPWNLADTAFFNGWYPSVLLIALAGLNSAYWLSRQPQARRHRERYLDWLLFGWGLLWWYLGGLQEIVWRLSGDYRWGALILFLTLSSLLAHGLERFWPRLRYPALALLPALALVLMASTGSLDHPFAQLGFMAWPAALAGYYLMLYRLEKTDDRVLRWFHVGGLWLLILVASWELCWRVDRWVQGSPVWPLTIWGLMPGLALFGLLQWGRAWPVAHHRDAYLELGGWSIALYLWCWTLSCNFASNGNPYPMVYLPLLNPLEIVTGLTLWLLWRWLRAAGARRIPIAPALPLVNAGLGAAAFLWLNGVLIRALHHLAAIPFSVSALFHSVRVQAGLGLLWSMTAVVLMMYATRRRQRRLWFVGAGLMAMVVIKLFVLDLAATETLERIVAFLAVGLLLLLVGYFAPAPPRAREQTS